MRPSTARCTRCGPCCHGPQRIKWHSVPGASGSVKSWAYSRTIRGGHTAHASSLAMARPGSDGSKDCGVMSCIVHACPLSHEIQPISKVQRRVEAAPVAIGADVASEQHREAPAHQDQCAGTAIDVGYRKQTFQLLLTRSPAAYTTPQVRSHRAYHGARTLVPMGRNPCDGLNP